ncbi:MAG TPA: hypothetical protein VGC41_27070 [Kofleriaceae bacterium]
MRVLALVLIAACGPIAYISQTTVRADEAVEAAREANADKYSPYWWTRATQYLHMSREVAGHADYQGANHFGRLAEEAAIKAKQEADAADHTKPSAPNPVDKDAVAPAKDTVAPAKDAAP